MKVCTEYSDGVVTLRPAVGDERSVEISDGLWNAYKRHREDCSVWNLLLYRIDNANALARRLRIEDEQAHHAAIHKALTSSNQEHD